jgi:hypothetical protein
VAPVAPEDLILLVVGSTLDGLAAVALILVPLPAATIILAALTLGRLGIITITINIMAASTIIMEVSNLGCRAVIMAALTQDLQVAAIITAVALTLDFLVVAVIITGDK